MIAVTFLVAVPALRAEEEDATREESDPGSAATLDADTTHGADSALESDPALETPVPFELLGARIDPGTRRQLGWHANADVAGTRVDAPVMVVHGTKPGPVLCLSSAIHGDELNGIEIVRRIVHSTEPANLAGTLVGVPVVNLSGFQRASRYLPDRRDLNRYFPGHPSGSLASRIAYSFFQEVVRGCDRLVDLHTGSFHRTNLPQLRADLGDPRVVEMTHGFGAISVMHSRGGDGTLRRAATQAGDPDGHDRGGRAAAPAGGAGEARASRRSEAYMSHLGMISRLQIFGAPAARLLRVELGPRQPQRHPARARSRSASPSISARCWRG